MMKLNIKSHYFLLLMTSLVLTAISGCIPEEDPIAPHDRGDVIIGKVEMGNLYLNQVYYSLTLDTVVSTNKITDWDIAFCSYQDSFAITINTAKAMRVLNTGKLKMGEVGISDTSSVDESVWAHDNPFGKLDSTAIGQWWESVKINEVISKSEVYIVDRGVNERGKKLGLKKMQINGFEENTYYITVSNLDGSGTFEMEIPKNPLKNFIQVSFDGEGKVVDLEPISENWDLCFTKYTEKLYTSEGDFLWYGVTGPLINPRRVEVYAIKDTIFDNISYEGLSELNFSKYINSIGHEWKEFNLGSGFYEVFPNRVYILKNPIGYFKFHFTDFYNISGEKGYPQFEYQKL